MLLDDFLIKYQLKEVFQTHLKIEKEDFINKMKAITDESYRASFPVYGNYHFSNKIKYVGCISKSYMELIERNFSFYRFRGNNYIDIHFNEENENDLLLVETTIHGISYLRFFVNSGVVVLLLIFCFYLLSKQDILNPLIILSVICIYLSIAFKRIKKNVIRVKQELSNYYNTIKNN